MTPRKQEDKSLMPTKYIRFKEYIIHTDAYGFCISTVQTVKKEDSPNYGRETATDTSYYSSLPNAIEGLCNRLAHDTFPDLERISSDIKELKQLISNGLKI